METARLSMFIAATMFCITILSAQDIIFTNTGVVYEGKIIEINDNLVKYKKKENPEGPVYSIEKSKVTKIKYSNNKEEVFLSKSNADAADIDEEDKEKIKFDSIVTKKKNIVGYDVAQFVFTSIGISYERFFGKNAQFSVRIPFSVGFRYIGNEEKLIVEDKSNQNYYYSQRDNYFIYQNGKLAGGAIEFNYYPLKTKKFTYFVGPYFEYGVFAYKRAYFVYNNAPYPYGEWKTEPLRYDGQHVAGGVNNGFLLHFNQIFTLTGTFGLGLKKDETVIPDEKILTQAKFNLIFGVKF